MTDKVDYIKRSDVLNLFACDLGKEDKKTSYQGFCIDAVVGIAKLPAADVRPNEHGKWTVSEFPVFSGRYVISECSNCSHSWINIGAPNFCPSCGAEMEQDAT